MSEFGGYLLLTYDFAPTIEPLPTSLPAETVTPSLIQTLFSIAIACDFIFPFIL